MDQPQKILVDLTPLLPGGINGGAKPFMLALLKELSDRQPAASFTAVVCVCRGGDDDKTKPVVQSSRWL